jgi:aspartate/methionine/tyrosine aminotransferase
MLPDFRLETYFAKWEFKARYHLTASDAETVSVRDLLALADADGRERWDSLSLGYTESRGMPQLREAIAATYDSLTADDILCFAGAEEALYLVPQALLGADDHAIVLTPNYQAAEAVPLAICAVTGVALREADGWALDVDAIEAALRPNTRLVSVNFPNNPTGAVPSPESWMRLVRLCDERGIHLLSDEVYRGLEQGDPLPQAADHSTTAISVGVMSKAYGLPGLRIGWIASRDHELLDRVARAKNYTTICNSAPSEVLALIALRARESLLDRNRGIIATNLPLFDEFFARHTDLFEWSAPQGGCVTFPRYLGPDGVERMCAELVEQAGVLLLSASMYASSLTAVASDRFRIGVGRRDPEPGLAAWDEWLVGRQ